LDKAEEGIFNYVASANCSFPVAVTVSQFPDPAFDDWHTSELRRMQVYTLSAMVRRLHRWCDRTDWATAWMSKRTYDSRLR